MHERLMVGVRGNHLTPGELRTSQNWIGRPGCTLDDATFVPPPVEEMHIALGKLERFINEDFSHPPLVKMAMVHYQFEAIHPFLDGNGRIGRLLLTLLLCSEGLLPQPLLYLSAYFERNRREYYDGLLSVSQYGDWTNWISFFLVAVSTQSRDAINRARRLIDLQTEYRVRLLNARSTAFTMKLMEELFSSPAVTLAQVSKRLGCTARTAQLSVDRLLEHGVVVEATGKSRNRVFTASKIVEIVEADESYISSSINGQPPTSPV
jgi:Fic family protein